MGIAVQEKDFGNEVRVSRERMREVLFRYAVVGFEFCFLCETGFEGVEGLGWWGSECRVNFGWFEGCKRD